MITQDELLNTTASLVGRAETDNRGLNHVCVRKVTQIMYRAAARIF